MCVPVKRRGNVQSNPSRPMGPQRTYSIRPSQGSALRRDHHFAAGELAVVDRKKEGFAAIPIRAAAFEFMRKGEMFELHQAHENSENITQLTPAFESAVGGFSDVGWKSKSEQDSGSKVHLSSDASELRRTGAELPRAALRSCVLRRAT